MIDVNLHVPNKIEGLYRASNLRMPFINEPAIIYYEGAKVGRGKVTKADAKTRLYDVELNHGLNHSNET
jgi:hypothetical protein